MNQAAGCFSKDILNFCNYEGIELIKSPVEDHRATGMVERTKKNYVLTYVRENKNQKFKMMISRALSALRFVAHSKIKLAPFEGYHRREDNTALRNLTNKHSLKNLDWKNVIKQKLHCLYEAKMPPNINETIVKSGVELPTTSLGTSRPAL